MRKFVLGFVGSVLLVVGLLGAAGVGWVLSVFGAEGRYEVPVAQVDVAGAALYVNLFDVQRESFVPGELLDTYVNAVSADGKDVFMGVGEQEAVQDFLRGVPYDAASELVDGRFVTRPVPGVTTPAPDPASSDIWLIQAAGPEPRLLWSDDAGAGVFVLMNADGSQPVAASMTVSLENPRLMTATWVAAGIAVLLALGGAILLALALRSDVRPSHR